MTTQQEQPAKLRERAKVGKRLSQRKLIIAAVVLIALVVAIIWILSSLGIIPNSWAAISSIIVTVSGALLAFLQSLHLFLSPDRHEPSTIPDHVFQPVSSQIPPIVVQIPATQLLPLPPTPVNKLLYRGIVGVPPPTDPRTIQQREQVVSEVYTKLIQPDVTAIALTGIGGVGKSTVAALIYRYDEGERLAQKGPFQAEAIWLKVDPAVTFADLVGNLFEALGKALPDLSSLAPQNQAVILFNALNTVEKPRLVILDQFENLLDWETGFALADRPGVGEWLDIINSQQATCHILLTSRPCPVGTRAYPPTYMQEHPVSGLEVSEGVELLRIQGVQGSETELQTGVTYCAGHAFSLTLLASLIRNHHMNLATLLKDPILWAGDIATNILDQIFTQRLNKVQRELLLAFSVYREPVLFEAAQAVTTEAPRGQVPPALKALRTQHLLEAVGDGHYQLHVIIANYVQSHFGERNKQATQETLQAAHARAAQYYLKRTVTSCPPREKRRKVSDVHDLIEAVWQYCQAGEWQTAYDLMEREEIFVQLKAWGGYAILVELCHSFLSSKKWFSSPIQEALIDSNLAFSNSMLGQTESALKYYLNALKIHRDVGNRSGEGKTYIDLGNVYTVLGQMELALGYYERALDICKEVGNPFEESMALAGLGWVYRSLRQKEEALKYYEEALRILKEIGNRAGEGDILNGSGLINYDLGKKKEALELFEEALSIRFEVGDRRGVGGTLNNLGLVYSDLGEKEQARIYYKQSLLIRQEIGDRIGEGKTIFNIGKLYLEQENYDTALAFFLFARSIFDEAKVPDRDNVQRRVDVLHRAVGDEQFTALLAKVEPEAQQMVEEALSKTPT